MKSMIRPAIDALQSQGHTVEIYNRDGQVWYEIDGRLLASQQEMGDLADRVAWLLELDDMFGQQRNENHEN
jgi:uncharacterized protein YxjI